MEPSPDAENHPTHSISSETFRPLKWNEQVKRGDFVEDGHRGFELWEGPSGFRADTFVKTIYRKLRQPLEPKKAKCSP